MEHIPLPPKTTLEEDLKTAGQRRINMIWEYTQAGIALLVVLANVAYVFVAVICSKATQSELFANAFFLVIGFYFGRTNHARIGDNHRQT